jgi:parallel beta-helix repeat protein
MTRRLSSEALNQLIPLLGSLAKLVARGSRVSEDQLRTLLLGVDLESDPAALEELKRWSQLLTALREQPSEDNRLATVEALMLRGLPEAPVLLAVDTVVRNEGSPPPPKRLRVSVERLDLGVLPPDQGATAEFEVQGGPGQVVVDSDQVRVTPQQFGAGVTRIRVEVKPLASGGALWTTLKLLTAGETLEVPVVAQWIPPTVSIPPGALVVAPDGSGNFRSLEEAVQQARPGAVIYLKAGIHRLKHPLVIDKPLTLIGEGMETTRIVCDGEGCVVEFSGDGLFSARDLAFVHEGTKWGDAVRANKGEVQFYRCLFTGGVWDEANQRGGSGLWLYGTARGDVRECVASGNEGTGIQVSGEAQPTLEGNTCRENKWSGIGFGGSAAGTARQNTCASNEKHGIYVGEQAQPTLEGNTCQENKKAGIAYFGRAAGTARQNTCVGNEYHGIYVDEQAQPTLEGNTCRENKGDGIAYYGSASGTARNNLCTANKFHGIGVHKQAQSTLEGNTCRENQWSGIAYYGSASGTARNNLCTANKFHGIGVHKQAQPTLEGNTCRENKGNGIAYFGSASGTARNNLCTANEFHGIQLSNQAQPALEGNTCRENKRSGIAYFGSASGTARNNLCTANKFHGIGVNEQAQPTLEGNTCRENKGDGIAYFGSASGTARNNLCAANKFHGIEVHEQSQPILEGNACRENEWSGIAYFGNAGGVARNNECIGNGKDGIYVDSTACPMLRDNRCQGNKGKKVNDRRRWFRRRWC